LTGDTLVCRCFHLLGQHGVLVAQNQHDIAAQCDGLSELWVAANGLNDRLHVGWVSSLNKQLNRANGIGGYGASGTDENAQPQGLCGSPAFEQARGQGNVHHESATKGRDLAQLGEVCI
jgi:hypothetical protein